MRAKKKNLLILAAILSLVLVFVLSACAGGGDNGDLIIEGGNDLNVIVGETGLLPVYVSNSDNKTLTYKSNNPAVITIDDNGNYCAVAYGKTTITVTAHDGTKKDVPVSVTVLAESFEKCDLPESEVIFKDPDVADLYYIFAKTTDKDEEFGPIAFNTKVLPNEAKQTPKITVDKTDIASVSATGKISFKLPKKGETDDVDVKVTFKVDNIERVITIKLCPVDDSMFTFDFTKSVVNQEYDNKNKEKIYVLRVFKETFVAPFKNTIHIVRGSVDFIPDVVVSVSLKNNSNVVLESELDTKTNQLKIKNKRKQIQPKIVTPIVIKVKDNTTGLECSTEVNVFYALEESMYTYLG